MMEWLSQRSEVERRRVLWVLMGVSGVFVLGLWGFTRWDEARRPSPDESGLEELFGGVGEAARGVQSIREVGVGDVLSGGEGSEEVVVEEDAADIEVEDERGESLRNDDSVDGGSDSAPRLPLE